MFDENIFFRFILMRAMVSLVFSLTFTPPWRTSSPPVLGTTLSSVPLTLHTLCQMSTLETSPTLSQVFITRGSLWNIDWPRSCQSHLTNIHPDFWYSEISLVIYFSFCSVTIRQKFWRIRKVLWDLKIPNACSLWDYSSCFPLQDWCLEKKIF